MMSNVGDTFNAEISFAPVPDHAFASAVTQAVGAEVTRRRRNRRVLLSATTVLAVGVLAVGGWRAADSLGWLDRSMDPIAPISTSPSPALPTPTVATAEPTPSPTVSAEPSSPWDQAGPGWFLVELHTGPDVEVAPGADALDDRPVPRAVGGELMLVSPEGELLDAGDLGGIDYSEAVAWWGDSVTLFRETAASFSFYPTGDVLTWDAATGEVATGPTATYLPVVASQPDGDHTIQGHFGGESTDASLVTNFDFSTAQELCRTWGATGPVVSPDGKQVVCFESGDTEGQTAVVTVFLAAPDAPLTLATFTHGVEEYRVVGWQTSTTMIFGRGEGVAAKYFTLDIADGSVADFTLPAGLGRWPTWDDGSATFTSYVDGGVLFSRADGSEVATLPCGKTISWEPGLDNPVVHWSGNKAIVNCDDGALWWLDGDAGSALALALPVSTAPDPVAGVFGYPPQLAAN